MAQTARPTGGGSQRIRPTAQSAPKAPSGPNTNPSQSRVRSGRTSGTTDDMGKVK